MKNQYFGDVNDYRKYGLLRVLRTAGWRRLLVAWMLTPDDGSGDGELRSDLDHPDGWKHFDRELFEGLKHLLHSEDRRRSRGVSLIEDSNLLRGASFFREQVPD